MNKLNLSVILASSVFLSACLGQSTPITGTDQQKAEKLSAIIEKGGQASCKVTNLADQSTTEIVVSGKKMKFIGSDFGEGKKGTMINDGTYNYVWSEGDKTGFKTKLEVTPTAKPTGAEEKSEAEVDTAKTAADYEDETKFKMDCVSRTISDSEFVPPADVKFTDFSQFTKMSPEEIQKSLEGK